MEDFEERYSQNVTRQSRNLKNLSDDDLSDKILNSSLKTDNFFDNPCTFFNIAGEERIECIKKLLCLDHLNQDQYEHVERLIINSADRLQIRGEPLEASNVLQDSIRTKDDSPVFSRHYRFPPVHKEETIKEVDELLKNKIIKPSQSPYNTPVWIVPKKPDSKGTLLRDFI